MVAVVIACCLAGMGEAHRDRFRSRGRGGRHPGGLPSVLFSACNVTMFNGTYKEGPRRCREGTECSVGPLPVPSCDGTTLAATFCTEPEQQEDAEDEQRRCKKSRISSQACSLVSLDGSVDKTVNCTGEAVCSLGPIDIRYNNTDVKAMFCSVPIPEEGCEEQQASAFTRFTSYITGSSSRSSGRRGGRRRGKRHSSRRRGNCVKACQKIVDEIEVSADEDRKVKDGCGDDDICSLGPVELEPETSDRQQYCAGEADRLAERACRHLDLATGEVTEFPERCSKRGRVGECQLGRYDGVRAFDDVSDGLELSYTDRTTQEQRNVLAWFCYYQQEPRTSGMDDDDTEVEQRQAERLLAEEAEEADREERRERRRRGGRGRRN